MKELREHAAYKLLKDRYDRVGCDYVILSSDDACGGPEAHRQAVILAFEILNGRFSSYGMHIDVEAEKMTAAGSSVEELLELPPDAYFAGRKRAPGRHAVSGPVPYWYAFLEPPDGTPYLGSDFIAFNRVLLPDRDGAEVYRWNDGFSNYFDAGREWWGTGLWSVLDRKAGTFIIIGASLTD